MDLPRITPEGPEVLTFDEIYQHLADGLRGIYGSDINLEPDSPDGQRIAIISRLVLGEQASAAALYEDFDPDHALGRALDRAIKYAGIRRKTASRSQADLVVETDRSLVLEAGYTVEDANGNEWSTQVDADLAPGANTITVFSEFGSIEAETGTINDPVTIIRGVISVSNPAPAVSGREPEMDGQLRQRRRDSVAVPSVAMLGSVYGNLANLDGVTQLAVYENKLAVTDELGIPPHGVWVVIQGGDATEIARVMAQTKHGGASEKGDIFGIYDEEIERPDGSVYIHRHSMRFDRPTITDLEIRVTATRLDVEEPIPTQAIAEAVAERTFRLAQTLKVTSLYREVYSVDNTYHATNLEARRKGEQDWTEESVVPLPDELFQIDADDVEVVEVIP